MNQKPTHSGPSPHQHNIFIPLFSISQWMGKEKKKLPFALFPYTSTFCGRKAHTCSFTFGPPSAAMGFSSLFFLAVCLVFTVCVSNPYQCVLSIFSHYLFLFLNSHFSLLCVTWKANINILLYHNIIPIISFILNHSKKDCKLSHQALLSSDVYKEFHYFNFFLCLLFLSFFKCIVIILYRKKLHSFPFKLFFLRKKFCYFFSLEILLLKY